MNEDKEARRLVKGIKNAAANGNPDKAEELALQFGAVAASKALSLLIAELKAKQKMRNDSIE